ncbi:MAG: UvrD-helicase domain-containing protein, partial [Planctomycetes bacterium]|nr:UvrD-helicase domain-containing protein [Planctomycetota bacterium]
MSKITLNPQQRVAAETLDRNMVVRAGAGCGKTATLVWRYINILKQDLAEVGEIAAITFTEKAANELKGRIHDRLRALFEVESPGPGRERWRRRLQAVESARIGTIHGFCSEILREFPIQAGVAPGFVVAEKSDAAELVSNAARDSVFDAVTAGEACALWAVERFGPDTLASMLEAAILKRERIAAVLDGLRSDSSGGGDLASWLRGRARGIAVTTATERLWSARFTKAVSVLEGTRGPDGDALEKQRTQFVEALQSWHRGDIDGAVAAILAALKRLQTGSRDKWGDDHARVKGALKAAKEIAKKPLEVLGALNQEDWRERALEMERFIELHNAAVAKYREAKRARGVLDFDDLLVKARDLLRDNPDVAASVAGRCRFILVDEFQDTDHVQAGIIRALTSPGADAASGRANLFVVGDAEQSIYRFRGAEVEVFSGLRTDYQKSGEGEATTLAGNYRSLPHILGFVNVLFGRLMPPGSGRHGSPTSHTPLEAKRGRGTPGGGRVEIILARSGGNMPRARQAEAYAIASRVKEIVSTGTPPVWETGDDAQEVPRPPRLGDIAVLLRSMSAVEVYEQALRDAGIRYHTVAGSTFYRRREVKDLVNLLRFVVDSDDTLSLAGALRSPLFAVSDDFLAQLVARGALNDYFDGREPDAPETADLAAFRRAVDLVGRLRLVKDRVPVRTIIDIIFEETGFAATLAMLYSGDRKTRNVYRLRESAAAFDASGQGGLVEFVRRVGALEQKEERESEAILEKDEADVVRIMTVHAAKGLEFPIVIVADMGRQRQGGGRNRKGAGLLVDRQLGLALPAAGEGTGPYRALLTSVDKARDDAEEKRIFFVAATRARDHLILSGAVSGSGPGAPKGWAKDVLDALEIDLDQPGDCPFDGFTVEYSTPEEGPPGTRRLPAED